jgi:hypothetical protein
MEFASMNHVTIEDVETQLSNILFVAEDYFPKNGKYIARNTTKLPGYKMLDIIIMLIFAPHATFYGNDQKNQYESFRLVGSELEFRFTHLFSGVDIEEINIIRSLLNQIIARKSIEEVNNKREIMIKKLIKFIKKERIKIISIEEWWSLFYRLNKNKEKEKDAKYKSISEAPYSGDGNNYLDYNPKTSSSIDHNKKLDKHSNDFLPPLLKLNIKEDYRLWSSDGIEELREEMKLFDKMRDDIVKHISETKKLIYTDKADIVCGYCNSFICHARNLKIVDETYEFISASGWMSGFVNDVELTDQDLEIMKQTNKDNVEKSNINNRDNKDSFKLNILNEYNMDIKWVNCKSNNDTIGIKYNDTVIFTSFSPLRVCYPTIIYEQWNKELIKNNFDLLIKNEKKYLKKREEKLLKELECKLCDIKMEIPSDYTNHVDKDPEHKKRMSEFLEENFTDN